MQNLAKNVFLISCYFLFMTATYAKISVVTTTTDLAAVMNAVGGDQVAVISIAKGTQDVHSIAAKPSFMLKISNADLVVAQGLELEDAWLDPLLQGARNNNVTKGSKGFLEIGSHIDPIEVEHGNVTRAEGDVHPSGNPHFQLDPVRLGQVALLMAQKLSELDAQHKKFYEKNADTFNKTMNEKMLQWSARIKATGIKEIVTYHKTFAYFCHRFNITCNLQLEPKPGIPPTIAHSLEVQKEIIAKKIKLILIENFYDKSEGEKLQHNIAGLKVELVPVSVEGDESIKTNEQLIEKIVATIEQAK